MKILILASNPRKDLRLDREIRDLKDVIEKSRDRQQFQVEVGLAVRVGDLQDLLFQHQPQIVHFCGHGGGAEGLVFEGNEGGEQWVRADALSEMFRLFSGVNSVLLNACYSEEQANAIVTHIDYVIGMRQTIRDDAAIAFSKGFYRALGYDCTIEQSFEFGCNAIQLEISGSSKVMRSTASLEQRKLEVAEVIETIAIPEHQKPILKKKPTLSAGAVEISTEQRVAIQVEVDRALEVEDASLREYREQVQDYLSDRQLSDAEKFFLDQLRDDLGLSVEETEAIIQQELAPIQEAQQAYARRLTGLIAGGFDPLDAAIQRELKKFQARRNLTDAEVEEISQPIFATAEAARQTELRQQAEQRRHEEEEKQHRYRQELLRATQAAYPIADSIRLALKSFQQQIGLSDTAAAAIEQPILERLEAKHQERLRQQESDRLSREAEERQRQVEAQQAEADRLSREAEAQQQARKQTEANRQAEADRLSREAEERQRQQAEANRQAEADRLSREAEQTPAQSFYLPPSPAPSTSPTPISSNWSRRRVIRTAGLAALGVAGTGIAVTGGRLLQQQQLSSTPSVLKTDSVTVNDKGEVIKSLPVQAKGFVEQLGNDITLEMVQIPGGKFSMGSPNSEKERASDESPQHQVTVPSFAIGKFEVTQAQWKAIASLPKVKIDLNSDPSNFKGSDRPVERVSWDEAVEFCDRLSAKTGKKCRLPSEAEWEYACRAGTTTPFNVGATLSTDLANYNGDYTYGAGVKGQYRKQTIAVGSFPPNAFGLYDMHGNVLEWCADYYHNSYKGAPTDGTAWVDGNSGLRVIRGGSWYFDPRFCRSAYRNLFTPGSRDYSGFGFRVVVAPRGLT